MANKKSRVSRMSKLARSKLGRKKFMKYLKNKQIAENEARKNDPILSTSASHASVIRPVLDCARGFVQNMHDYCPVKCEEINDTNECGGSSEQGISDVNISDSRTLAPLAFVEVPEAFENWQDSQMQLDIKHRWSKFFKNDEQLKLATGIESFELLQAIIERMKLATNHQYENNEAVMNTENRVMMTYLKLKQNLMYEFLALMFNPVSEKQCEEIFKESVTTLGQCLQTTAISWPSKRTIVSSIPHCFKNLKSVRVMINCLRISMYTKSRFSQLHDATSFRIMIGVTPGGMISFIDHSRGGNLSNLALFKQSQLLRLMQAGDVVLVHKDFPLGVLSDNYKFHIIECGNSFQRDLPVNSQIVHAIKIVDHVLAYIKEFDILHTFPLGLLTYVDHIITIICATFNLSSPIINDGEFMTAT